MNTYNIAIMKLCRPLYVVVKNKKVADKSSKLCFSNKLRNIV